MFRLALKLNFTLTSIRNAPYHVRTIVVPRSVQGLVDLHGMGPKKTGMNYEFGLLISKAMTCGP